MRAFAIVTCLLLSFALASPAAAQGLDKDKLEELIEKTTEKPKKPKKTAKPKKAEAEKPKTDRTIAKELRKLLKTRKATVAFAAAPLTDVLEFLRTQSELKIVLSEKATREHGQKPVTLRQQEKITLRLCLDTALTLVSPDLRYGVKDGVIWIGLEEETKGLKLAKL